jgi:hypothetical protein
MLKAGPAFRSAAILQDMSELGSNAAAPQAYLDRLLARLEVAVDQQTVPVRRAGQPAQNARIVEHVRIHQQNIGAAAQELAARPQRDDGALVVARVEEGLDPADADRRQLGMNIIGPVADDQRQLIDAPRAVPRYGGGAAIWRRSSDLPPNRSSDFGGRSLLPPDSRIPRRPPA